jgi:hypothetical protein
MNQKKSKGLRKQYRKDVQYFLENGGLYELFELIIKPKPRFTPKWVWMFCMRIFINVQEDSDNAGKRTVDK